MTKTSVRAVLPSRPGLSRADRAMWDRLYAKSPLQELPWFTSGPYPPLARAVEAGWLTPPGPLLDVGCGLGANAQWLATQGFDVTGADVAPGAIAAAESRRSEAGPNARFLVDDILATHLPAGRFRGAIDTGCFHTLPARRRTDYAQGLARVLRPEAPFLLFWVAREEEGPWGPPHRLSVRDVVEPFEPHFRVDHIVHRPRPMTLTRAVRRSTRPLTALAGYTARLVRRRTTQPPPR
jgi:SAM-dependent methyltransferase